MELFLETSKNIISVVFSTVQCIQRLFGLVVYFLRQLCNLTSETGLSAGNCKSIIDRCFSFFTSLAQSCIVSAIFDSMANANSITENALLI